MVVDGGADDFALILTLIGNPDVNIRGIVCNHGNIPVENCAKLVGKALTLANRKDIPVYLGADCALNGEPPPPGDDCFKDDGLNGAEFPNEVEPQATGSGAEFLRNEIVRAGREGKRLTLFVSSPMTSVAQALNGLHPDTIKSGLKAAYIMGGCFRPIPRLKQFHDFEAPLIYDTPADPALFHPEQGNIHPWAEFNVFMDPRAWAHAANALAFAGVPSHYVGWDMVTGPEIRAATGFVMTKERLAKVERTLPHGAKMAQVFDSAAWLDVRKMGSEGALISDLLLALAFEDPALFPGRLGQIQVVVTGDTPGRTILSPSTASPQYILGHNPNADMLLDRVLFRMARALTP